MDAVIIIEKCLFCLNKPKRNSISKQRKITVMQKNATEATSCWKAKSRLRDKNNKNNKHKSTTPEAKIKKRKTPQSY